MQFITGIFWNRTERRLRSFWRLAVQGGAWFGLLMIGQFIIGVVAALVGMALGLVTPEQLNDPAFLAEAFMNSPILLLAAQTLSLMVTFLTVWLAGRFLDRRRFVDFGFRFSKNWWIDFAFGLFLGAFLMLIVFLVELAAGWVTITDTFVAQAAGGFFPAAILIPAITFLFVGISEETFSRGYQLTNLAEGFNWKRLGPRWAVVIATLLSSAIFGALHLGNPNATVVSTLCLMLAGVQLALGYILTGDLALPIGLHITWNFFEGNVFGFPVSGTQPSAATFIAIQQGGPDLWTGGTFGPEAGLIGLLVTALGCLLIVLWVRMRYGRVGLHAPIAEAPERPGPLFGSRAAGEKESTENTETGEG